MAILKEAQMVTILRFYMFALCYIMPILFAAIYTEKLSQQVMHNLFNLYLWIKLLFILLKLTV